MTYQYVNLTCNIHRFADNTTTSANAHWTEIPSLVQDLNNDLDNISEWPTQSGMIINIEKTKLLLKTGKRLEKKILEKNNGHNLDSTLRLGNDQEIKQVSCQKLLGVTLNKDLTYEAQIDNLCKQLSKGNIGLT